MKHDIDKDGFQIFKGVIPAYIIKDIYMFLTDEMHLALQVLRDYMHPFTSGDIISDIDYLIKNKDKLNTDNSMLSLATGLYPLEVRLSEKLRAIHESDTLISKLQELLQTKHLKMHMPPAARFVLPNNIHAMAPAHQDTSYNTYVEDFLVVWVPFTKINKQSGGVAFFEGTSKLGNLHYEKSDHPYWMPPLNVEGFNMVCFELEPGDVIIFNKHAAHQSMLNISPTARISIDYRFFDARLESEKHCYDLTTKEIIYPKKLLPSEA